MAAEDDEDSEGLVQSLNVLSTAGRGLAQRLGLDEAALQSLEAAEIDASTADGIVAKAGGKNVRHPSRYATTAARRTLREVRAAADAAQGGRGGAA